MRFLATFVVCMTIGKTIMNIHDSLYALERFLLTFQQPMLKAQD